MEVTEEVIMQIISLGGTARSHSMMAIRKAKDGDLEAAKQYIKEASEVLLEAHSFQTKLIQNEAAGVKMEISLLMIHAQDHLMNAITIKDMAKEFINLYEKIQ